MEINNSKFERQRLGAERWRNANGIGTFDWVQQFGKTYGTIIFVMNRHLQIAQSNSVIVVVPSEVIQKQWYNNIQSYGVQQHRVQLYTASYILTNNIADLNCTLLIIDEIHKFTTEDRISIINGFRIKSQYRLALTGSYPYDNPVVTDLYPVVDKITETEAIENNWISNFEEYNILLELSDADKLKYITHSIPIQETLELFRGKSKHFSQNVIKDDYALIDACYRGSKAKAANGTDKYVKYDHICNFLAFKCGWNQNLDISTAEGQAINTFWNPKNIHERAKNFITAVQKRNEILINNPVKLKAVGELIQRSTKTTICFNESTEFADKLADYINALFNHTFPAICYHSKLESRPLIDPTTGQYYTLVSGKNKGTPKIFGKLLIKRYVLEFTNSGYFKFLSTAKALDEGVSIPQIEQVICTGGSTNPISYDQRTARGKTINHMNPDKITLIFNLVFDDFTDPNSGTKITSRDKQKLIIRQSIHSDRITWVKSISEIDFDKNL